MPINYAMAKKVGAAQKNALKAGDCLKIVETFRPYEVQMLVKDAVYAKARTDKELMTALNKARGISAGLLQRLFPTISAVWQWTRPCCASLSRQSTAWRGVPLYR